MIEFTIDKQKDILSKQKSIKLSKDNTRGKLYLLKMYEDEIREWHKSEEARNNRKGDRELKAFVATIMFLAQLFVLISIDFEKATIAQTIFWVVFLVYVGLLIYFVIQWFWKMKDAINEEQKSIIIPAPEFFIKLLNKLNEGWRVSSVSNWWPIHYNIVTESEEREIKKMRKNKKYLLNLKKNVERIKNPFPLCKIIDDKETYIGKRVTLDCLSGGWSYRRIPNGFYNEYFLYDATGSISLIDFKIKNHFWKKVPKLDAKAYKNAYPSGFYYRVTGVWTKVDNLYYLQLINIKNIVV